MRASDASNASSRLDFLDAADQVKQILLVVKPHLARRAIKDLPATSRRDPSDVREGR
jgi:hypothetical protein